MHGPGGAYPSDMSEGCMSEGRIARSRGVRVHLSGGQKREELRPARRDENDKRVGWQALRGAGQTQSPEIYRTLSRIVRFKYIPRTAFGLAVHIDISIAAPVCAACPCL